MKVFLSYPRKDKSLANALKDVLARGGHTVWMDNQLVTGQDWRVQLDYQIKQADVLVLALTPNWLDSAHCQWEFVTAVENEKKVIPVLLAEMDSLPDRISRYQYANFIHGFNDPVKVQKFLDDMLKLAVIINKDAVAELNKESYLAKIHEIESTRGGRMGQSQQTIINSGTIQGGNVVIGGLQYSNGAVNINVGNLDATINNNPNASSDDRAILSNLVNQLQDALRNTPQEQQSAAQKVADRTKELVAEVNSPEIEPDAIKMKASLLKKAAENIKEVFPTVLSIATQIIAHVLRIGGVS